MNAWISFAIYLFYRFIRFLCHLVQNEIVWRFNGVRDHLTKIASDSDQSETTCQLLKIIYRKKLILVGVTNENDFMWWHDSFANPEQLLANDSCWTLYTLDENFAYFVLMPKHWPFYNAKRAPFVFIPQFTDGRKLARMPLKAFCRFADKTLEDPKGPVIFYTSGARSGSTLLTRVMQVKFLCLHFCSKSTMCIVRVHSFALLGFKGV